MLDRQELLKNSIPPTTCGICFDSFTTFELDSQPPLQDPIEDVSSKAQFAFSFAARLARSLTSNFDNGPSQQSIPEASSSSPPGSPSPSSIPTAQSTGDASSTSSCMDQQPPAITPSVSSKDLGITMPCNHGLCLSCLQSFLTNAANSPQARFPTVCPQPGCRTPIPTESAELVLEPEILEIWYRRLAEVHVANKVCCPKPECRSIIDLDDRDGTAVTCPDCRSSYCASCAVPFHQGMTCEQFQAQGGDSEEDRAMHQLVQDRRWRHCPSCRFVIEKQQGCNHMVCHCGQSFCYACGHSWDEIEARCSRDCERNGADGPDDDDVGVECRIM
ncbi:hypothetical protein B0O80DRAFT_106591 [Mortierella sp. GBAus27b]|nr:hypothetical protein B0O80DRAFT_106591 [Mortierella sp. GBAus27b]